MNLSFAYLDDNNQIKRVSFPVKETDVKINYSSVFMSGNGVYWNVEGQNRYLTNKKTDGVRLSSISDASTRAAVEDLFDFSQVGGHILKMDGSSNWHNPFSSIPNYSQGNATTIPGNFGKTMFAVSEGAYTPVCTFQWFNYLDQRHLYPQESGPTDVSFNGGFMYFQIPGITPHYPYTPSAAFTYPTFSLTHPAYLALYQVTIVDDVAASETYGQEIPCLMQCHSGQQYTHGGTTQSIGPRFTITDMRLIDKTITPKVDPVPNAAEPKKNSTPAGWAGNRSTASASDSPTKAPAALKNAVNWGEHGVFLYTIDTTNLDYLSNCLWSKNLLDVFARSKFSPATAILALLKLPYSPDKSSNDLVVVKAGGMVLRISELSSLYVPYGGIVLPTYETVNVQAYYIYGGQEQESNPIFIEPFFNSFLDFEPYTQVSLRLPFVGMVQVPPSAIMGGYLKVNYIFDNRNGNFVCQVMTTSMRNAETADANGYVIIAQYSGCCALPMAITGNTQGGMAAIGAITGFASSAVQTGIGLATDNAGTAISGGMGMLKAVGDFVNAPHQTQLVGTLNAEASCMADLTVRVLISRPVDVTPGEFEIINGVSTFVGDSLIQQKGLAAYSGSKVRDYEGMTAGYVLGDIEGATAAEMTEIRNLFLGGVIV